MTRTAIRPTIVVMTSLTPRDAAQAIIDRPVLWSGTEERFAGYGIMGQPFDSGHYLALRHFPATSIGAGYCSVWHRNPEGEWTFYATSPAERSCARYFSAAAKAAVRVPIDLGWDGPGSLRVRIPDVLSGGSSLPPAASPACSTGSAAISPRRSGAATACKPSWAERSSPCCGPGTCA